MLAEAWRAPSTATPVPVVAGSTAVTGTEGQVLGRDAANGRVRWRYARDLPLCTVGSAWGRAVAVYRKSNCSEVTSLEGATGERSAQRTSDAELDTRLLFDDTYLTTTGNMVESWRSDLVRTQQYGIPPNPRNPDNNLSRPECEHTSVAVGEDRVAVIEECPRETGDRITVIKTHPEDDEEPDEVFSTTVGSTEANVVATTNTHTAVVLRDQAKLVVYDSRGSVREEFALRAIDPEIGDGVEPVAPEELHTVLLNPAQVRDLPRVAKSLTGSLHQVDPSITEESVRTAAERAQGPLRVAALTDGDYERLGKGLDGLPGVSFGGLRYWHTGSDTAALDTANMTPLWTVQDTLGPGALFGGRLLVPVRDGLAVLDPGTGVRERIIPVDRSGYAGPIELGSVGNTVLEQRGDTLVGLR